MYQQHDAGGGANWLLYDQCKNERIFLNLTNGQFEK